LNCLIEKIKWVRFDHFTSILDTTRVPGYPGNFEQK
jgi:hypothetical protein